MKILQIEWKHFEKQGKTCYRCNKTGENLKQIIAELREFLLSKGVKIQYNETKLRENQMGISNSLLLNGIPIESVLEEVSVFENTCNSCSDLAGRPCCCRAVKAKNKVYEEIPKKMIKQAIIKCIS